MKDDYTTNSHYITYTFSLYEVGRMYFLDLWVKGLVGVLVYSSAYNSTCRLHLDTPYLLKTSSRSTSKNVQYTKPVWLVERFVKHATLYAPANPSLDSLALSAFLKLKLAWFLEGPRVEMRDKYKRTERVFRTNWERKKGGSSLSCQCIIDMISSAISSTVRCWNHDTLAWAEQCLRSAWAFSSHAWSFLSAVYLPYRIG